MAHEIGRKDNMMYVETEGKPWHGLGTPVPEAATSAEAFEAAQMDWKVDMVPVFTRTVSPDHALAQWAEIKGKKAARRSDTEEVFGVMSDSYRPLQNIEAFEFMDKLAASGEMKYHTAGSLFNGRKIWLLAKLPGTIQVAGDSIEKYILLANTHDGSGSLIVQFTAVRVVCNNTMQFALGGGEQKFKTRHTTNIMSRVDKAVDLLGLSEVYFNDLGRQATTLVNKPMRDSEFVSMTRKLFDMEGVKWDDLQRPQQEKVLTLQDLFHNGDGNEGLSAYDALNAFTQYVDHESILGRNLSTLNNHDVNVQEKRLDSAWFGGGAGLKQAAWDELVQYAGMR